VPESNTQCRAATYAVKESVKSTQPTVIPAPDVTEKSMAAVKQPESIPVKDTYTPTVSSL
jgi:hypothetical protein